MNKMMGRFTYSLWIWLLSALILFSGCEACIDQFTLDESLRVYERVDEVEFTPYCLSVALTQSGAKPFERVDLDLEVMRYDGNIMSLSTDGFGVEVDYEGLDESLFLPVYFDYDEETHYFIAPHHPAGIDGGQATLVFTDDVIACEDNISWTVEAIPYAPGAIEDAIEAATTATRALVESYGFDPEVLVETPLDEMPAVMVPLAMHIWTLDHPDNPRSLLNQLRDNDLPFEFTAEDLAIAEAYIAQAGFAEGFAASLAALDEIRAEFGETQMRFRSVQPMGTGGDIGVNRQALCSMFSSEFEVEIDNAQELSEYMKKADLAETMGASREVVSNLVNILSLVPVVSASVGSLVGLFLTFDQLYRSGHANLFPRYLFDAHVDWWTDEIFEDYHEMGVWNRYYVSAGAEGWDATAELANALVDLALVIMSARQIPDSVIDGALRKLDAASDTLTMLGSNVFTFLAQQDLYIRNHQFFDGTGHCELSPGPWPDIEVTRLSDNEVEFSGNIITRALHDHCADQIEGERSLREYEPVDFGIGTIHINAAPAIFPPALNRQLSRWEGEVAIPPIDVSMDARPANHARRTQSIAALPGEIVEVAGRIYNAHDRRAEWSIVAGEGTIVDTNINNDYQEYVHYADIQLPESDAGFPVVVALESTTRRGLRSTSCEPTPRRGFVVIHSRASMAISPQYRCIAEGESLQFEAEITSFDEDPLVEWTASGGSIDSDGLFYANSEGVYIVTARMPGADLEATAQVRVGPCECFYDVSLTGGFWVSRSGFGGIRATMQPGGWLVVEFGDGESVFGKITTDLGHPGIATAVSAQGIFQITDLPANLFNDVGHYVAQEDGRLVIQHWAEDNYIQGFFRGRSHLGIIDDGGLMDAVEVPMTDISAEFMVPVTRMGDPLASFTHDCEAIGGAY